MAKKPTKPTEFGCAFKARKGRNRPALHRDRVVEQAVAILDAEGPDALTFRRLAAALDAGVATLYWHVDSKQTLLDLALDHVAGEVGAGFDAHPDEPWDVRLRDGLCDMWRLMRRHPWAAHQAIVSSSRGPNLMHHWDRGAALLFSAGLDEREVFFAMSSLFTYVVGLGVQDAAWHVYDVEDQAGARADALAQATAFFDALDPAAYPSFRRVVPIFAGHDEDEQFLAGVDLMLAGVRARVAAATA